MTEEHDDFEKLCIERIEENAFKKVPIADREKDTVAAYEKKINTTVQMGAASGAWMEAIMLYRKFKREQTRHVFTEEDVVKFARYIYDSFVTGDEGEAYRKFIGDAKLKADVEQKVRDGFELCLNLKSEEEVKTKAQSDFLHWIETHPDATHLTLFFRDHSPLINKLQKEAIAAWLDKEANTANARLTKGGFMTFATRDHMMIIRSFCTNEAARLREEKVEPCESNQK